MLKRILAALSFSRFLLLLPALTLFLATSTVFATSPNIVISQVYGGAGCGTANCSAYKNDYIELFNRGNSSVSVNGWSVQYASATGTGAWTATALPNVSIPAGGYFLVAESFSANGTLAIPAADVTATIAMASGAGKVALVNSTVALNGACPIGSTVVDLVGYGTTANCNDNASATSFNAPVPSTANAVFRAASGCTDTDVNSANFTAAAANPRNSATATSACNIPDLTIADVSLAEGNSGTTTFTFTVSLSSPAGVGGVTFNIATADGTATVAGSDYVAKSLTSQSIPQGMSSYTFTVDVTGDLTPETNETFFVNVTNLVGALPLDTQGLGTIVNDDIAPDLNISNVSQSEGNDGTSIFTFTVSLSAVAPPGGVTFNIATADGTATAGSDYVSNSVTGATIAAGNQSYTFDVVVNGDTTPEPNETFFVNVSSVTNAVVITSQGIGTIVNDDLYRIHDVQGSGTSSPLVGQQVLLEGIVTGVFQGANSLNGFYIQEPDALVDADPATSEGVFVFTSASPAVVSVGDLVRVSGNVTEFGTAPSTLTEIVTPTVTVLSTGNPLPAVTDVSLPVAALTDLERYEGMRVRFVQTLTVSDHFDLAHFGELTLKANGRALQPTNEVDLNDNPASGTTSTGPNTNGAAVTAFDSLNVRSSIILDDANSKTYPAVIPFIDPVTHTLRLGSTVDNLTGIFSQSFGSYRIFATTPPAFNYAARPLTPPSVGGNVKVASANVLNYFNGDGLGGGFPTSRGANSLLEFNRQRDKTISAIGGLNADVVGLLEMENDGTGVNSAVQDLVNGLNAVAGAGTWAIIPDPAGYCCGNVGTTDLIRPVIIYKPAVVTPVGASSTYIDSAFTQGRAPVAQTFALVSNAEKFTLVMNHFKSKGSGGTGQDADQFDGQAFYNNTRRLQSQALLTFLNTLTAATPRIITMGDFNAYEQEDPIDILRAGGLATIINNDTSYMFNGLSGSLDHALGTPTLISVVSGAGHWHINADEPVFLDYNVETKVTTGCSIASCTSQDFYDTSAFRASDHDPVLVGLQLTAPQCVAGTYSVTGNGPCTAASPGNFVAAAGATAQVACTAGTFQANSGATSCNFAQPGNFVASTGATSQTSCLPGSFQADMGTTSCNLAQAGNFVSGSGATVQTTCSAGSFQALSGASSCDSAQPGNFVAGSGATAQTACLAGTFQANSGATSCSSAQPGNFVSGSGANAQTACLAGTFQANSGASSCDQAQAGNFVSGAGAIAQTTCIAGTFQASSGATACGAAQPGNFVAASGATSQTACSAGTFQSSSGATSCSAAQPGNFVAGSGATAQTPCAAGSFQASASQTSCGLAQPGFFVAATGATSQTMCPAGTTSSSAGATACTALYNVTPSAGANGTISPSAVQTVSPGAVLTFTVTPSAGFIPSVSGSCGGSLTGSTYTTNAINADCTVTASFTPALALTAVQSRKLHAGTPYDVTIDTVVGNPPTVESRAIGTGHTIIYQFNVPITAAGTASAVDAASASIGTVTTSISGNDVVVTITNLPDNQRVTISLTGVNGTGSYSTQMGFLVGDVNNTRSVNSADISGVKARSGLATTAANFRFDLNASGAINSADISAVKARSGLALP